MSDPKSLVLHRLAIWLRSPAVLMMMPAGVLVGYWIWGETGLAACALGLPLLAVLAGTMDRTPLRHAGEAIAGRNRVLSRLEHALTPSGDGSGCGCIVLQFDNAKTFLDRHGRAAQEKAIRRISDRLAANLREQDVFALLEGGGFAIALGPMRRLDLETIVQLAARLQKAVAEPVSLDAARYYLTCSVGICLQSQAAERSAGALLDAAQIAADEALRHGPGAIRVYAPGMSRKRSERDALRAEIETALDEGQIRAWFQPQVSADTGEITGFEALARWKHPERGMVPPAGFLPALAESGLSERLSEVMLFNAMVAIARWDKAGLRIPAVGVNFSNDELRNPRLPDKLRWELDRFDLSPDRLAVEILETVVAGPENDVIAANVNAMARMGCRIDLDDFGTGHTSITNIRRFAVHRLKIDRSFVTRAHEDREQQRILSAILSMAERLNLDTLAEGVETGAEQAILAQLGCGHLQGYGIGRPMPFEETFDWIASWRARTAQVQRIGQQLR